MQALVTYADYRSPPAGGCPCGSAYCHPRIVLEDRAVSGLAPGYLRIEIARVGICGSDLGVMLTEPGSGRISSTVPLDIPPAGRIPGHEGVGIVREVGAGVTGFAPGDWVTLQSLTSCGHCPPCLRGALNQCLDGRLVGFQCDGIFAESADLPASLARHIGAMADSEQGLRAATCIEPAACALVALQASALRPGANVLIFGAGPIGVFTAMLCRNLFGAARVDVVEPVRFRRNFARQWVDNSSDAAPLPEDSGGCRWDLLVEASGALENVDAVMRQLAPNARVLLLARGTRPLHLAAVGHMITNGIAIIGSRGHLGGAFETIIALWGKGQLPLEDAVTGVETGGLDAVKRALESPQAVAEAHCKLQVLLR